MLKNGRIIIDFLPGLGWWRGRGISVTGITAFSLPDALKGCGHRIT